MMNGVNMNEAGERCMKRERENLLASVQLRPSESVGEAAADTAAATANPRLSAHLIGITTTAKYGGHSK